MRSKLLVQKGKRFLKRWLFNTQPAMQSHPKYSIMETSIKGESDYYLETKSKNKIFSHNRECLDGAFDKIFQKNIYDFNTDKKSPVILDCGANIGLGVIYWKEKFPQSKIIAFEPSREVFNTLTRNVAYNNFSDVLCVNKALGDSESQATFTANEGVSGSLVMEKSLSVEYTVEVTRLSNYMTEEIDFLKLDIEGSEKYVIPEIAGKLHLVRNIFIEYHSFTHEQQYLSSILKLLEENNFRYYIEGEYAHDAPLAREHVSLMQDLQVSIWANRQNK
ncbi:MAG: FkbM family methyltransferase [Saprospirales bacterium]|nr:FkbM family methyltransferase [Saprospirales bacterium]